MLHGECEQIFRIGKDAPWEHGYPLDLHQHQREAIEIARGGASYMLTTGTGSGKSLSYIVPIVDSVLRQHAAGTYQPGVKAIIVYPMNALANSQQHELTKFLEHGYPTGGEPVTFRRYTGQDREAERVEILADPPDILLTNYVMLELVLTRPKERDRLITAGAGFALPGARRAAHLSRQAGCRCGHVGAAAARRVRGDGSAMRRYVRNDDYRR